MNNSFNIPNPCPENWDKMKIVIDSRFCEKCTKNIIDFTNKTREEIFAYLLANNQKKVCGRIYKSQLDFSYNDLVVTINSLPKEQKNSNLTFYLLSLGTLILSSCNNETIKKTTNNNTEIIEKSETTEKITDTLNKHEKNEKQVDLEITDIPILGDIILTPDTTLFKNDPFRFVDIMPEFKGGYDSLVSFISENLKYPEWEQKNKIEGKVYVTFVISETGKIKDINIVKSVKESRNFDNEVIRVLNLMPDWIPGKHNGKNVDVAFSLPINFQL